MLWPWGFTSTVTQRPCPADALAVNSLDFNNYMPEQAIGLYATDGTTDDFGYGDLGVASYTFELGTSFFQDPLYLRKRDSARQSPGAGLCRQGGTHPVHDACRAGRGHCHGDT